MTCAIACSAVLPAGGPLRNPASGRRGSSPCPEPSLPLLWRRSVRHSVLHGSPWNHNNGFRPRYRCAVENDRQSAQLIAGCEELPRCRCLCRRSYSLNTSQEVFDTLQQAVSPVNQFPAYDASFRGQAMWFDGAGPVNVHHLMSVRDQPIRDQHAVAAEVYPLGAHVGGARALGQSNQFGHRALELRGQHIVGIIAEARVAKPDVGGVFATFLAIAAKGFHPDISDSGGGQAFFQRLSIKLRQPPRHGEGTDIHQGFNSVTLKRLE